MSRNMFGLLSVAGTETESVASLGTSAAEEWDEVARRTDDSPPPPRPAGTAEAAGAPPAPPDGSEGSVWSLLSSDPPPSEGSTETGATPPLNAHQELCRLLVDLRVAIEALARDVRGRR